MRVLQITEDFSSNNTGVTTALAELSRYLSESGVEVHIVAVGSNGAPALNDINIHQVEMARWGGAWRFASSFRKTLGTISDQSTVMHLHGIWMYPQWEGMRMALHKSIPFVLTPHNMLGGWLWRLGFVRRVKKRIYWELMVSTQARRASVIHALSQTEKDILRQEFFPSARIEVIPNGIDLAEVDVLMQAREQASQHDERYLLFLGRLHPVKGLERLLDALASCRTADRLVVAGPCHSRRYLDQLHERVRQLRIAPRVQFVGPVRATEKWSLLRGAWAVCLPSFSEGMSMVSLEAMAARTPVISSSNTAISGWKVGGGLVFDDAQGLNRALMEALSWSDSERRARGNAARNVVERNFDWKIVGNHYHDLYRSLIQ